MCIEAPHAAARITWHGGHAKEKLAVCTQSMHDETNTQELWRVTPPTISRSYIARGTVLLAAGISTRFS
jgi:hypothetical protein